LRLAVCVAAVGAAAGALCGLGSRGLGRTFITAPASAPSRVRVEMQAVAPLRAERGAAHRNHAAHRVVEALKRDALEACLEAMEDNTEAVERCALLSSRLRAAEMALRSESVASA